MIVADQPTCFPDEVFVSVSSRQDGTLLDRTNGDRHDFEVVERRKAFCDAVGLNYESCVYQIITYEPGTPFDTIVEVALPDIEGKYADVLYTETEGIGLFLPVADCISTVIYDPRRRALALAHIGRHASLADTLAKTVKFFMQKSSRAEELLVWMAPSVKQEHYRMEYFDRKDSPEWRKYCESRDDGFYVDLQGYNYARATDEGVLPEHIIVSPVDTAIDPNYFSHSQGDTAGRFAVLAILQPSRGNVVSQRPLV